MPIWKQQVCDILETIFGPWLELRTNIALCWYGSYPGACAKFCFPCRPFIGHAMALQLPFRNVIMAEFELLSSMFYIMNMKRSLSTCNRYYHLSTSFGGPIQRLLPFDAVQICSREDPTAFTEKTSQTLQLFVQYLCLHDYSFYGLSDNSKSAPIIIKEREWSPMSVYGSNYTLKHVRAPAGDFPIGIVTSMLSLCSKSNLWVHLLHILIASQLFE